MGEKTYFSNQRRIRANTHIRELAGAVVLSHLDFIQPLFVDENINERTAIRSLNGINSDTENSVLLQVEEDLQKGISKFLLFPVPAGKSLNAFDFSFVLNIIRKIKAQFEGRVWIAADCCLCSYTTHGHCGILNAAGTKVLNNESVAAIAEYALQLAKAGADCIAPSDMMDGRIGAIRSLLDENGLDDTAIMSYSAKFSSQFYGPFRDACKSAPGNGCSISDRKSYQLSAANPGAAINATLRDIGEGADIVMVKPAVPCLDIIHELKNRVTVPVAAYHVSGEYQGIELLAKEDIIERDKAHLEIWTALKRGGANIIISYAARNAAEWIKKIIY